MRAREHIFSNFVLSSKLNIRRDVVDTGPLLRMSLYIFFIYLRYNLWYQDVWSLFILKACIIEIEIEMTKEKKKTKKYQAR